ncbi:hypothetical protein [Kamptonema sp. PCC 6506]|uniref:hypothetical protein n=1 Tax=Kamptonema sp. PCC 6506 TaxID=272129 RepID=UPI0012F52945|nr:hypothetical protein [Kamptonema sp. PCC 6506]
MPRRVNPRSRHHKFSAKYRYTSKMLPFYHPACGDRVTVRVEIGDRALPSRD